MIRFLFSLVLLTSCQLVLADGIADAAREMSGLGAGAAQTIKGDPGQFVPRYEGQPAEANSWYGGGAMIPKTQGNSKITGCATNPADPDIYQRQECEGINFVSKNRTVRPDVSIDANEKLATGTHDIVSDPKDTLDKYGWTIPFNPDGSIGTIPEAACGTETIIVPERTKEESCSIYYGAEFFLCQTALNVQVDPNFNYSCLETKLKNQNYNCNKVLNAWCEISGSNCAGSGIHAGSPFGDMLVSFYPSGGQYLLEFGTIGDNYWGGGGGTIYDRTMYFNVVGKDRLAKFYLQYIEFDDYLQIKINGHLILVSPGHASNGELSIRLVGTGRFQYPAVFNGNLQMGRPELNRSNKVYPGIDLRPYLVEGQNVIETRTVVGGEGESFLRIETIQQCLPNCVYNWVNGCQVYEARQ